MGDFSIELSPDSPAYFGCEDIGESRRGIFHDVDSDRVKDVRPTRRTSQRGKKVQMDFDYIFVHIVEQGGSRIPGEVDISQSVSARFLKRKS